MSVDLSIVIIILACALVTFIPRIMPFAIVRNLNLPPAFLRWLTYIPVCLLTALIVQGVIQKSASLPTINWSNLAVIIPTLWIAWRTKSLLGTVLVGVASAALLRWLI
ncbi:Branched-chain amino acid transport protein (AzlD) [compost metagenome]